MKLADALARYLVQLEADGRSPNTVGQYRRHLQILARWLTAEGRPTELATIDHEALAAFLAAPVAKTRPDGKGKRSTAMNCLRSSLRTFFSYAHQTGLAPTNPAAVIKRAICSSPPPRSLSDTEQEKILSTLAAGEGPEAERDHLLFDLMLGTGVRLGSALAIEAADVDLERSEVTLRSAKGDRPDTVFFSSGIHEHLKRYLEAHPTGPLFTRRDGHPVTPRHVERRFREWLRKAGITRSLSPHSLRHAFAQGLYRRTGDILLVKEALRHKSIASTLVYAKAGGDRLRKVLA